MRTRMFAAATVALAALSLTACNDDGVRDEGGSAKPSKSATETTPGGDKGADTGSGATGGSSGGSAPGGTATGGTATGGKDQGKGTGKGKGGTTDPYDPANRVPCTAANTSVTATPVQRPLNHMLITVTNTGSKMCDLKGYPILKFDQAQSVPPVIEESKPQAVTSLKPGAKGYAAAILSAGDGSGGEGYTAQSLKVGFQGSDRMADAALQARGVHVDDSLRVTYWLTSSADALT
ncbi:DUF4232 domain-containing protein [Streptomyces sp. NPDC059063]|uniref:DUF4232 domain-containing protein n=1 Tax=unclassified Streptomyces TaxID=2593676 RepID=UPI0036808B0E